MQHTLQEVQYLAVLSGWGARITRLAEQTRLQVKQFIFLLIQFLLQFYKGIQQKVVKQSPRKVKTKNYKT